jgi:beta-N-acetylhexosaminidase
LDARVQPAERQPAAEPPFQLPESLHERIGQMLLVGFRGLTPQAAARTLRQINEGSIGSVLLFDVDAETGGPRNVESREQLTELVAAIKEAGRIPPLVTVDAEGGFFHRLKTRHGFPPTPPAMDVGERNDPAFTRAQATVIAEMLCEVGIDMNLAPVVDLLDPDNLPEARSRRSFSPDPDIVTANAREFIMAHRACGILTALKHFPGMRGTLKPYARGRGELIATWDEVELTPYQTLISEGLVDAVLAARVTLPQLDPDYPACLSTTLIESLLRRRLGFDGVVISDRIELQAIWDNYGFARGMILAVNAGVDIILMANDSRLVEYCDGRSEKAVKIIEDAVGRGEIPESRIDDACTRILALKARRLVA